MYKYKPQQHERCAGVEGGVEARIVQQESRDQRSEPKSYLTDGEIYPYGAAAAMLCGASNKSHSGWYGQGKANPAHHLQDEQIEEIARQ